MADSNYWIIRTTVVPEVREVRYYAETVPHIISSHPELSHELPSVMESIIETVESPTRVYRSETSSGLSFVFSSSNNTFWGLPLHVPVKVIQPGFGRLRTAYYSASVRGTIVWEDS